VGAIATRSGVDARDLEAALVFDRFDRMFDEWMREFPFRWPLFPGRTWSAAGLVPVDEYQEDGALVVRAELPGIDPQKDVELTVSDHMLHIEAERPGPVCGDLVPRGPGDRAPLELAHPAADPPRCRWRPSPGPALTSIARRGAEGCGGCGPSANPTRAQPSATSPP